MLSFRRHPLLAVSAAARPVACASLLTLAATGCIKAQAQPNGAGPEAAVAGAAGRTVPPLRDAAQAAHRFIGVALATYHFSDPGYQSAAARYFNSMTPENEMKWESIQPRRDKYAFEAGDALVSFAEQHAMRVRGHTLVWHSQLAPWVKTLSGDELHAAMLDHVKRVVEHYKGHIAEWDVVNEAIADGPSGQLRSDSPWTALGPSFIDDAFRAAHEADPSAVLFYNDYDIEQPGTPKTEAALALVKRLKDSGVPIGGVGFQMHVDPRHWPTAAEIRQNFEQFAALGLQVEITEMDVPIGEIPGTHEQKLEAQKTITHDIVAACMAVPKCTGVTFWELADQYSWLNDPHWAQLRGNGPHNPLLLDASNAPKPIYFGVLEALQGH